MGEMKWTPGPWNASIADVPYAEIGEGRVVDCEKGSICIAEQIAHGCVALADAMLAERARQGEQP